MMISVSFFLGMACWVVLEIAYTLFKKEGPTMSIVEKLATALGDEFLVEDDGRGANVRVATTNEDGLLCGPIIAQVIETRFCCGFRRWDDGIQLTLLGSGALDEGSQFGTLVEVAGAIRQAHRLRYPKKEEAPKPRTTSITGRLAEALGNEFIVSGSGLGCDIKQHFESSPVIATLIEEKYTVGARKWEQGIALTMFRSDSTPVNFRVDSEADAVKVIKAFTNACGN